MIVMEIEMGHYNNITIVLLLILADELLIEIHSYSIPLLIFPTLNFHIDDTVNDVQCLTVCI